MTAPALVQKLWNYCNILRDDGLSCGDYVEQLTFLLFDSRQGRSGCAQTCGLSLSAALRLKMADGQSRAPWNKGSPILKGFDWPALLKTDGDDLEMVYRHCSFCRSVLHLSYSGTPIGPRLN